MKELAKLSLIAALVVGCLAPSVFAEEYKIPTTVQSNIKIFMSDKITHNKDGTSFGGDKVITAKINQTSTHSYNTGTIKTKTKIDTTFDLIIVRDTVVISDLDARLSFNTTGSIIGNACYKIDSKLLANDPPSAKLSYHRDSIAAGSTIIA